MPEGLALALDAPGLSVLVLAAFVAGTVYGFAGFGAALIFMPVATAFLPAPVAVAAFSLSAAAALVTLVPGAWREAERRTVMVMIGTAILFTPLGVWALGALSGEAIRTAVSVIVLVTLAALVAGWRIRAAGWGARGAVAAVSGMLGGATGLNGPPVILFNLGADQPVAVTRANLTVFLTVTSLSFVPQLWAQGLVRAEAIWLGAILFLPYAFGTRAGAAIFDPAHARLYRGAAYVIVGLAGVAGLPLFG
jgi:uncharacterized membrane protein YfcA